MIPQHAYPLTWPAGWARTPAHQRESGQFEGKQDQVRTELLAQIDLLVLGKSARTHTIRSYVVISTNLPLRQDGYPRADARQPDDPGVAVYFTRKKKPVCFACDKFDRVWKNMRAIQRTIEAMRGIERWGSSQLLERAFQGFAALPERTGSAWWDVLGVSANASADEIRDAYRRLARERHPDAGGTHDGFVALQEALRMALQAVGG